MTKKEQQAKSYSFRFITIDRAKEHMAPVSIWDEFLDIVRQEEGSRVVETWFKAVLLERWDPFEKKAYLQAPNAFVCNWILSKYTVLIQTHLARLLHVDSLKVQVHVGAATTAPAVPVQVHKPESTDIVIKEPNVTPATMLKQPGALSKQYSFDSFVVGPNNALAYAAAQAVAENPGGVYNPLFIYGSSGLGKTHLLHAIGNHAKKINAQCAVLYQTADRFVNEFISAIRFERVHKFKAKYQNIDLLLIDDIQFFSHKDQTQEAFFHIFNTLHEAHKQIVFSSDVIPQNLSGIAERLRSRMAWGLVADMYTPPLETKIAILKRKAQASNEYLSDDVAHYIATTAMNNIRELEGALIRVIAFAALTKQPIDLAIAQKVLMRNQEVITSVKVDFDRIMQVIKKRYSYNLQELQSKKRNKDIARVRHIALYLMKKLTDKSLRDIGLYLGGRDHSTVMHAHQKMSEMLAHDNELMQEIQALQQELGQ
jgi:chromosomal replication initiator protein